MQNEPEIRTDISISIHPGSLAGQAKALDVDGSMGRHIYTEGHIALHTIYNCIGEIIDVRRQVEQTHQTGRQVMKGKDLAMEVAYPKEFFTAVDRAIERASRSVDSADAGIRSKINSLQDRVKTMLSDPATNRPVAAEIRAHAKSLSTTQRLKLVRDAAQSGDKATLASILGAPAYLSGMSPEEMDTVRKMAEDKFAPLESEQLRAAEKVLDRVRSGAQQMIAMYGDIRKLQESPGSKAATAMQKLGK